MKPKPYVRIQSTDSLHEVYYWELRRDGERDPIACSGVTYPTEDDAIAAWLRFVDDYDWARIDIRT